MRDLATRRYLLLLSQVAKVEKLSARGAAKRLGIDPSYAVKLRTEENRKIELDAIGRARKALNLSPRWFDDAGLGNTPDYREHRLGTTTERETERGTANVEAAIAAREAAGRPLPDAVVTVARGWRSNTGDFDPLMVEMMLTHALAALAGRALPERPAEGQIEEDRGQRPLPSSGRKKH